MHNLASKIFGWTYLVGLFLMLSACAVEASPQTSDQAVEHPLQAAFPNVLIIIADDMGVDTMGVYGLTKDAASTPNLDALAAKGVLFENAWATPACSTTRAALLTGKYGINNGVIKVPGTLPAGSSIIHSHLRAQTKSSAMSNAAFGKWHLGGRGADPSHPNSFGIDHYAGNVQGNVSDYFNWDLTKNGQTTRETTYHTTKITDEAIEWIGSQSSSWLAWVAYSAPHGPFHLPPQELHNRQLSGTEADIRSNRRPYYLAAIEAMDTEIGRLLKAIPADERENTLIIFLGDNGSPRGVIDDTVFSRRHGKSSLYEGGIRIPFIVSGAGISQPGRRSDSLINIVDVYPTVAELLSDQSTSQVDGVSFAAILAGDAGSRSMNYAEYENGWAVSDGRYKFIRQDDGTEELYDMNTDPDERSNVIQQTSLATVTENLKAYGLDLRGSPSTTPTISPSTPAEPIETLFGNTSPNCADYSGNYEASGRDVSRGQTLSGRMTISVSGDRCVFQTNSVPNHDFNDGRRTFPNVTSPVDKTYSVSRSPTLTPTPTPLSISYDNAILLNGIKVDVIAAGCYGVGDGKIGCNDMSAPWRYNPMFEASGFNVDSHHAHTQNDGTYHYHGPPPVLTNNASKPSGVIGFAADGFPIYGPIIQDGSGFRTVKSSYKLKTGSRPTGSNNPGGQYDGTFVDDFAYVAGSGDLDACNGMTVNGQYAYYVTDTYPYVLGCFSGTPDTSFSKRSNARSEGRRGSRRNQRVDGDRPRRHDGQRRGEQNRPRRRDGERRNRQGNQ